MRFCCALEADQAALFAFATAAFEAYFGAARNLDDPEVLVFGNDQLPLVRQALMAAQR